MSESTSGPRAYVLAHLRCGCTLMQLQVDHPGLFSLLQHVPLGGRAVFLWCPLDGRQQVARLMTRTRKREHWPLMERRKCAGCSADLLVPPPAAEGDEDTMPHDHLKDGVRVRCPHCRRWGTYGYGGTAESYYDMQYRRTTCPHCRQTTVMAYNPYTLQVGEQISFSCLHCRQRLTSTVHAAARSVCRHCQRTDVLVDPNTTLCAHCQIAQDRAKRGVW